VDERTELLVIGAGPAGLAASIEAARLGLKVVLVDENPVSPEAMGEDIPLLFGGRMSGAVRNRAAMTDAFIASDPAIAAAFDAGVDLRLGTLCWGVFANGPAVGWLPGPVAGLADAARSWMIGAAQVIVCAGRRDMGLAFPGWELPGVMGMVAAERLARSYGALDAREAVVLGSTTEALDGARRLRDAGVRIAAMIELAPAPVDPAAAGCGIELLCGHVVRRVEGADGVRKLVVAPREAPGREREIPCDTVILGVGAVPVIELLDAAGCGVAFAPERGGHVPVLDADQRTTLAHLLAAGDCAGIWPAKSRDPGIAREEGRRAARSAAAAVAASAEPSHAGAETVCPAPGVPPAPPSSWPSPGMTGGETPDGLDLAAYRLDWVRATVIDAAGAPYVCRCEEVTAQEILEVRPPRYLGWTTEQRNRRDLASLLGAGAPNPDLVKRLTRAGMGVCQGRRCREQVAALLALGAGVDLAEVPLATYRAPVRPLPLRLAAQPESPEMAAHWDTWFGMASQYVPFWDAPRRHVAADRPVRNKAAPE
jgi:thioredoxin reductase